MENMNQNESFKYTYSAKEQEEIKQICQKYQPREENKMEQLRRLDSKVTEKASVISLALGIVGALIMGSGMSLVMTNVGEYIGWNGSMSMVTGIIIGIIGIACVSCAYPIYNRIVKKERERIAPEILRLAEELMK